MVHKYPNQVKDLIKGKKTILSQNFIQFWDKDSPIRTIQYDPKEKRWYEYKETGRADNPTENFIGWIT